MIRSAMVLALAAAAGLACPGAGRCGEDRNLAAAGRGLVERAGLAPAGGAATNAWFRFQGDTRATGRSPFAGPKTARLRWRVKADGWCSSPAVDSGGRVYFFSGTRGLVCLNESGEQLWVFRPPAAPPPSGLPPGERKEWAELGLGGSMGGHAPLVAPDGTVYFGITFHPNPPPPGARLGLYALRPDGVQKWFLPTDQQVSSSPNAGADQTVYFTTHSEVIAVDREGGRRWSYPRDGRQVKWSSPAIAPDGTVYVVDGRLLALTPEGKLAWAYAPGSGPIKGFAAHPTVADDGTIYFAAGERMYAVSSGGVERWTREIGVSESSPALGPDGTLFIGALPPGSKRGALLALNPRDGSRAWSFPVETYIDSSPAVGADGTVYFGSDDGVFYAVSSAGKRVWALDTGRGPGGPAEVDGSPALGPDGTLFFGHGGGPAGVGGFFFYAIKD